MAKSDPQLWAKNKLSRYENSKVLPPLGELGQIMEHLQVSLGQLASFLERYPEYPGDSVLLAQEILGCTSHRQDNALPMERRVSTLEEQMALVLGQLE